MSSRTSSRRWLAGDVGGTKTLVGLFERARRRPAIARRLHLPDHGLQQFHRHPGCVCTRYRAAARHRRRWPRSLQAPLSTTRARLTNIDWDVNAARDFRFRGTARVKLVNDLEAMAASADVLTPDEVVVLQEGRPHPDGNAVVIAAGTGLGEAYLHRVAGRLLPLASEGGHA